MDRLTFVVSLIFFAIIPELSLAQEGRSAAAERNRFSTEFLYHKQLVQGVGLAGLDRAQMGLPKVVRFERSGPKVFLIAINYAWRSSSPNPDERLAVKQSFPESVLWGFPIAAEGPGSAVLVDATEFFLRDAHGVPDRLATAKLGVYRLDPTRSAISTDNTKNFPLNTVVESMLTFSTEQARGIAIFDGWGKREGVAAVTPDPHFITVRERLLQQRDLFRLLRALRTSHRRSPHDASPPSKEGSECGGE
jgi:hypothetical protein